MAFLIHLAGGRVVVEVTVSVAGKVVSARRMSPPRPYYVGDDPKTCDAHVSADRLGAPRVKLFDFESSSLKTHPPGECYGGTIRAPSEFPGGQIVVAAAADARSLSFTIGDVVIEVSACEDADLLAVWSDFQPETRKKEGLFSDDYTYIVACLVSMPVRVRCPRCATELEGRVTAKGDGLSHESLGVAEEKAREDALDEARKEVLLARCPKCRRRDPQKIASFAVACSIGLAFLVGNPACVLFTASRGPARISISAFIPCIVAGIFLAHRIKAWFAASSLTLTPVSSDAADPHATPRLWREELGSDGTLVLSFFGVNQDAEDRRDVANFGPGIKPQGNRFKGCLVQGALLFIVSVVFANRGVTAIFLSWVFVLFCAPLVFGVLGWLVDGGWRPDKSKDAGEFRLSLSAEKLTIGGPGLAPPGTWSTREIDRFVGASRLAFVGSSGRESILPCRFPSSSHETLATRLNEWLGGMRGTSSQELEKSDLGGEAEWS